MCIYTYILKFSELMSNHNSKSLKKMCVFISNIFDSHFSLNQYSLVSHWTRIYTVCLRLHELQVSICLEYCLYLSILCFVLRPCHQSIVLFPIFQLHISAFLPFRFCWVLIWLWCKQTKVSWIANPPICQGWLNLTVWYLKKSICKFGCRTYTR